MTRDEVKRRALAAAAKIAFGITAACASDPPPPQAPTTPAGPSTQTGSPAATAPPPAKTATTGPDGCSLPSSANPTDAEMKCCLDAVNAVPPKDRQPFPDHVKQCCEVVARKKSSMGYDACCEVTGPMTSGCTPWGPPVPPRMVARRRA